MLKQRLLHLLVLVSGLLILAACGGGPSAAEAEPPATEAAQPATAQRAATAESTDATASDGVRTFVIVPEESTASYLATEEFFADALRKFGINPGFGDAIGVTQEIEGQFQFDFDEGKLGDNRFTANLLSLTTEQQMRDNWIKDNALESSRFPLAEFVAQSIDVDLSGYSEGEPVSFNLVGEMTIREITQPLTFVVTATLDGDTLSGVARADSRLTDWGITPPSFANTLTVNDDFAIQVDFTAREQ